ncbi:MAG: sugar ABC transporter permease [Firmicutes bacterium]|nr:sugar ABC transporter permease [Bacillota bacterium]
MAASVKKKNSFGTIFVKDFKQNYLLYLLVLPVIAYYIIFHYGPMGGIVIAFKNFKPNKGIFGSPWANDFGFQHFLAFFNSIYFSRTVTNTLAISLYSIVFGFPAPILLALMMNEVKNKIFKRTVQTLTYFPHFISTVVICGMVKQFCLTDGLFNQIGGFFGSSPVPFLQYPQYFRTIYTISGIWQGVGWDSIIYLAAITGVDMELHEAAALDGAGRFKRIWHITLPAIKPTIVILLIMKVGGMMSVGSEKILLLYNEAIYETADVISTYTYRRGLLKGDYSFSTAVSMFNSLINFILVCTANAVSRKVTETSLF